MARAARRPRGPLSPEWAVLLAGAREGLTSTDRSRL
jgi:hypothetical protein